MSNNIPKTLATIKADSAHRGNASRWRNIPIPFKPKEVPEGDKATSVKIKVTENYSEVFDLFEGGADIESYCRFFQQVDGAISKQRLREISDEHQAAYDAADDLLKAHLELKPNEEEGAKEDDEAESSSDESSDSESDGDDDSDTDTDRNKKTSKSSKKKSSKKPASKKLTKLERWTLRRKKMKKRMAVSKKMIRTQAEKAFRLQESLFGVEQRVGVQKITREVCYQEYEDEDGDLITEPRGHTWETFRLVRVEYMLTVCKKDAAEQQRYYLMWAVQKPYGMPYRTFQTRMMTINSYLPLLPCIKDSDMATDATVRMNVSISDHDMANLLLRACNAEWEAQWALVNTYLPSSMRGFLSKMEAIEQVMETQTIPRRQRLTNGNGSDKATSSKSTSKGGQKEGSSNTGKQKHCQLCQTHGGAAHTHNTKDCRRYTKEGKERSDFGKGKKKGSPSGKPSGSSDYVSKKSYKQMRKRAEKAEAKNKKRERSRDSSRDRRRRRKRDYYSDSDSSGSESDY